MKVLHKVSWQSIEESLRYLCVNRSGGLNVLSCVPEAILLPLLKKSINQNQYMMSPSASYKRNFTSLCGISLFQRKRTNLSVFIICITAADRDYAGVNGHITLTCLSVTCTELAPSPALSDPDLPSSLCVVHLLPTAPNCFSFSLPLFHSLLDLIPSLPFLLYSRLTCT